MSQSTMSFANQSHQSRTATSVVSSVIYMTTLLLLSSCASKQVDSAGAKSGSSSASAITSSSSGRSGYHLPEFEERQLPNGLKLLLFPDDSLPYVSMSLMIKSGSAQDPADRAGLSTFVAELLDKGTVKRTATQIANELGQMGADFNANSAGDYTSVAASALSNQSDALLQNMVEIVTQPAFSAEEVERLRKQFIAQISRRVDNPDAFADAAFEDFIFGEHAYAHPSSGTPKSVASIARKHIIQHYLRYYRPSNAILAVVGKFKPEFIAKVEQAFGGWQNREVPVQTLGKTSAPTGVQVRLVDKPGLVQAQIRLGHLGIKRKDSDFLALRMANTILGGAFASRLNDRIRKDLGLTYSISSYFDARQDVGPFEVETFTKNETVGQTIKEAIQLLSEFKEKGINSEELNRSKGYLKGVFPTAIETREKLAFNLMVLRLYGVPDSYLTNYLTDIDRLSVSAVNDAIRRHVDPKNLKIIVYTNAEQVAPQLEGIGQVEIKKAGELLQ